VEKRALQKVRAGDPITADDWNALLDAVRRNEIRVPSDGSLSMQKGPTGTLLQVKTAGMGQPAVTSSTITARSGTMPGTGTVTPKYYDGSALASDGGDLTVYFFSASATIASGKYCWIQQDQFGEWWITSVEC